MKYTISSCGDQAIMVRFVEGDLRAANLAIHGLSRFLAAENLPGLVEQVPGFDSLLVVINPRQFSDSLFELSLKEYWMQPEVESQSIGKYHEIPVMYGGENGPDLDELAQMHGLTTRQVIEMHASPEYFVFMIGFTPGFAYLGEVDAQIATPRRNSPRSLVPAGSVGIAGRQTGIYPTDSPGGWQIIGRTMTKMFNPVWSQPCLLAPGDRVRFVPTGGSCGD